MKHSALQSGLDYVFSFFERGYRRQTGRYDREVRRPDVFAAIAADHHILPPPARTILITGSKGKGTCARLVAAYLQQQGKKVGLVVTPEERHHLDRIRIDGRPIVAADFLQLLASFQSSLDATADTSADTYYHPPTAIFLLIALKYFREREVDYLVIEGGRGAQFDEIGQLPAAVGIVTSVLPEHLKKLGPTLRDVCLDKFSLASHCEVVVCSAQSRQQAQLMDIPVESGKLRVAELRDVIFHDRPAWLATADAMAREVLQVLGMQPGAFPQDENIFASCQVITERNAPMLQQEQVVFLDGAIAADCLDFAYIVSEQCRPNAIVFGMSADKDAQAIADAFAAHGYAKQFFFKAGSGINHVAPLPFVTQWAGSFDTKNGLDEASRNALLELIAVHKRVYIVGVQIFLRSVRNALT